MRAGICRMNKVILTTSMHFITIPPMLPICIAILLRVTRTISHPTTTLPTDIHSTTTPTLPFIVPIITAFAQRVTTVPSLPHAPSFYPILYSPPLLRFPVTPHTPLAAFAHKAHQPTMAVKSEISAISQCTSAQPTFKHGIHIPFTGAHTHVRLLLLLLRQAAMRRTAARTAQRRSPRMPNPARTTVVLHRTHPLRPTRRLLHVTKGRGVRVQRTRHRRTFLASGQTGIVMRSTSRPRRRRVG